jgi:hypothetical protein
MKASSSLAEDIRLAFGDSEDVWRNASPVAHVKNAQAGPAFYFISLEPSSVEHKAAERMVSLIRDANGEAESDLLKGQDLFGANRPTEAFNGTAGKSLIDFIRKVTMNPARVLPIYDRGIGEF